MKGSISIRHIFDYIVSPKKFEYVKNLLRPWLLCSIHAGRCSRQIQVSVARDTNLTNVIFLQVYLKEVGKDWHIVDITFSDSSLDDKRVKKETKKISMEKTFMIISNHHQLIYVQKYSRKYFSNMCSRV